MGRLKSILLFASLLVISLSDSFAQNYDDDRIAMTNFIVRMYKTTPFEGVKVFTDYDHSYILSVLALDPLKYPNPSTLNRIAGVKAMSQASRYLNGAEISSDMIVRSVEYADGSADTEIMEHIREKSIGYVRALKFLTSLDESEHRRVFIFCKELEVK